jgi:hypothetical protein
MLYSRDRCVPARTEPVISAEGKPSADWICSYVLNYASALRWLGEQEKSLAEAGQWSMSDLGRFPSYTRGQQPGKARQALVEAKTISIHGSSNYG